MRRFIGSAIIAAVLTFSCIGLAHGGTDNGKGNGGQNNGNQNGKNQDAPELSSIEIVSGVALLCGGLLLLNEGRRRKEG